MKLFILLPFFFIFTIISTPERYYEVFFKESYNTINGILVSDTKERIKLIEAVYPNLNIVEIEKKGIMNIIERNDIKIELVPFCKNSQKNICMDIKKYEIDKTKTIDMTLNATEELKQFKFNSNDKFKVRIYNFRTRSFDNLNIKEIKYLKGKGNEKNIIYFEKEDFHLSIELKKSYDYKNWGIVDIEKLN